MITPLSQHVETLKEFCGWAPSKFLFISDNVFSSLIYYSHILPILVCCTLAILLFVRSRNDRAVRILIFLCLLFSAWSLFDLITWANEVPELVIFFWSTLIILEPIIFITTLYFLLVFIRNKDITNYEKLLFFIFITPTIILLPTEHTIQSFNLLNCEREATEGWVVFYGYVVEVIMVSWGVIAGLRAVKIEKDGSKKKQILLVTTGFFLFLLAFSWGNISGSITEDWSIGQYGLLGMPVFIGFLVYVIVAYKRFNTRIFATQALVASLWLLMSGILLINTIENVRIITSLTLIVSLLLGFKLIKGVKREIEQREKIERLAIDLEIANSKLKELDLLKSEFLSFASHQLRNPLTAVKGYASLVLEGDYGKVKPEITTVFQTIYDSTVSLLLMVQDFLDVTKITQGGMKYDMQEFDLRKLLEDIIIQEKPVIDEKGLTFDLIVLNENENYTILGDANKLKQVFVNVIDNSIKYTLKGSLKLILEKQTTKYIVSVKDTGVGISQEDIAKLFEKFSRATGARKINVTGSGLGLYLAKQIVEAHEGSVRVESPGVGLGSTFIIELPVL